MTDQTNTDLLGFQMIGQERRCHEKPQTIIENFLVNMSRKEWDSLPSFGGKRYAPKGTEPGTKYKTDDGPGNEMGIHGESFLWGHRWVNATKFFDVNIID